LEDLNSFIEKFINAYNNCKDEKEQNIVVDTYFLFFKTLLKTIYDKVLNDNVKGQNLSNILNIIDDIPGLRKDISALIASIQSYISHTCTIIKPLFSTNVAQDPISLSVLKYSLFQNAKGTILRDKNNKIIDPNNRHTFHASDSDTRFSTASSSDESAKSDGFGNSALNNIEEQQQEPLMNTRLAY
jgi:flagellar biosynthesis component FlhA